MTKRSPIVDPEEPDDVIRIDASKITAGSITADQLTIKPNSTVKIIRADGSSVTLGDAVEFDATEYIKDRYGPVINHRSSSRGLYQPIKPTWRQQ